MSTTQAAIVQELYRTFQKLGAPPELLGVIGSWGDTLSDEEVLTMLRVWNESGRFKLEREAGKPSTQLTS